MSEGQTFFRNWTAAVFTTCYKIINGLKVLLMLHYRARNPQNSFLLKFSILGKRMIGSKKIISSVKV